MKKQQGQRSLPMARRGWLNDPALSKVLGILNAGGTTRVAGGAVRNALLGVPVADVDLATTLAPEAVMAKARDAQLGVHPTGLEHGTVTVVADGRPFEVTTLRIDVETFGRHARVDFTDNWEADARRRDFTMNALYCDADGKVHDPLGGYRDLERRIVRFVGKPQARINEDYLRILRFFRFNAQYGRGTPHSDGLKHSVRLRRNLLKLSGERIRQELWKLLAAPRAVAMLRTMKKHGVTRILLGTDGETRTLRRMTEIDRWLKLDPDPLMRLHLLTGDVSRYRERLKLTNAEMARVRALSSAGEPSPSLRPAERRAVLYQLGRQAYKDSIRIAWAASRAPIKDTGWKKLLLFEKDAALPQFPVSGADLIARGMKPGPAMGRTLRALEDWWIAAGFPEEKEQLLLQLAIIGTAVSKDDTPIIEGVQGDP
ncbi:MAG TPA: CCA tRNA nucleotidyltransferase [Aestuariivirgaceae bacterium]|nr:CCA tRNA nucleotidyltransferase [Aestuariivirgaceae bacterium]